jgi:hypothetical protein
MLRPKSTQVFAMSALGLRTFRRINCLMDVLYFRASQWASFQNTILSSFA